MRLKSRKNTTELGFPSFGPKSEGIYQYDAPDCWSWQFEAALPVRFNRLPSRELLAL